MVLSFQYFGQVTTMPSSVNPRAHSWRTSRFVASQGRELMSPFHGTIAIPQPLPSACGSKDQHHRVQVLFYCKHPLVQSLRILGNSNIRNEVCILLSAIKVRFEDVIRYSWLPTVSGPACNLWTPTKAISAVPSAQTSQAQRRAQPRLPTSCQVVIRLSSVLVQSEHVIALCAM